MTEPTDDLGDRVDTVAKRIAYLDLLRDGDPRPPSEIVDELEDSRSTVTRALEELQEADLVEQTADGYVATLAGAMAGSQYRRYRRGVEAIGRLEEPLEALPPSAMPPVEVFVGAEAVREKPASAITPAVREATSCVAYLPRPADGPVVQALADGDVERTREATVVLDSSLWSVLDRDRPAVLENLTEAADVTRASEDGLPYAVVVLGDGLDSTVSVVFYDDSGVTGAVTTDSNEAVQWARDELGSLD